MDSRISESEKTSSNNRSTRNFLERGKDNSRDTDAVSVRSKGDLQMAGQGSRPNKDLGGGKGSEVALGGGNKDHINIGDEEDSRIGGDSENEGDESDIDSILGDKKYSKGTGGALDSASPKQKSKRSDAISKGIDETEDKLKLLKEAVAAEERFEGVAKAVTRVFKFVGFADQGAKQVGRDIEGAVAQVTGMPNGDPNAGNPQTSVDDSVNNYIGKNFDDAIKAGRIDVTMAERQLDNHFQKLEDQVKIIEKYNVDKAEKFRERLNEMKGHYDKISAHVKRKYANVLKDD